MIQGVKSYITRGTSTSEEHGTVSLRQEGRNDSQDEAHKTNGIREITQYPKWHKISDQPKWITATNWTTT